MQMKKLNLKKPCSKYLPPWMRERQVVFKYKDSVIIRTTSNKHIHHTDTNEIQRQISNVFIAKTQAKVRKSKERKNELVVTLMNLLLPMCDQEVRSDDILNCLSVEVNTDDMDNVCVEIKTQESGIFKRQTDFTRKMIFCKTVNSFCKKWKSGDCL